MKRLRPWRWKRKTAVFLVVLFLVTLIYQYSQLDIDYYLAYEVGNSSDQVVSTAVYHSEANQLVEEIESDSPWTTHFVVLPSQAIYASAIGHFEQGELIFHLRIARENDQADTQAACTHANYTSAEDCYSIAPNGGLE